ncbi:hypothetical protein J4Q44_G00383940, partial [Coregonus suidteri]
METATVVSLTMAVLSGFCHGDLLPAGPLNGALGENMTFNVTLSPPEPPKAVTWSFGVNTIIILSGGTETIVGDYKGRVTLSRTTGSLELRNLSQDDSGEYTVNINTAADVSLKKTTRLKVFEIISNVDIPYPTNLPIMEGNSVTLTCDASGSISTREWMKAGQPLSPSDNILFSEDNKTASINPVKRTDSGIYMCRVSNPINSDNANYNLTVNYGPDGIEIKGPTEIEVGQKFTLTCSADSIPTASYTWMHNGTKILGHSPELIKGKSEYFDSGNYTCTATNYVTGNNTSAVHELSVAAVGSLTPGLSAGAITGIVIVVLVVVGGAVGVA